MDEIITKLKNESIYYTVYIIEFNKAILHQLVNNNTIKIPEIQTHSSQQNLKHQNKNHSNRNSHSHIHSLDRKNSILNTNTVVDPYNN